MTPPRDLVDVPFDPSNDDEPDRAVPGAAEPDPGERIRLPKACRLNLWHRWEQHTAEDGGRYQTCRHCGAYPRPPGWA